MFEFSMLIHSATTEYLHNSEYNYLLCAQEKFKYYARAKDNDVEGSNKDIEFRRK